MTSRILSHCCVFLAILSIVISCRFSAGSSMLGDSYPFANNNTWVYLVTDSVVNVRSSGTGDLPRDTIVTRYVTVMCKGQIVLKNAVRTWWMHSSDNSTDQMTSDQYYDAQRDTLKSIAYRAGEVLIFPRKKQPFRYQCGNRSFSSFSELRALLNADGLAGAVTGTDSITYESDPPTVLVYPLEPYRAWDYRRAGSEVAQIRKTVLGIETVQTPAGVFPAAAIRWQWRMVRSNYSGWDTTMSGMEYVGAQGLLKRRFVVHALITDENGNTLGTANWTEQSTAVSLPALRNQYE